VSKETITQVLEASRWAPSGGNGQRWRVTVATGAVCQELSERLAERARVKRPKTLDAPDAPFPTSPQSNALCADLREIAQSCGQSLWEFGVLGSYQLYNAPVVIAVSRPGKWGNAPQFVTTMLLAAHDLGLGTCWLGYPFSEMDLIREILAVPEEEGIEALVALGYPDPDAPANTYRSPRDELEDFVRWVGFD
jgi:nitroreductase